MVVGDTKKTFVAKEPVLVKYLAAVRRMEKRFIGFSVRHIPRAKNTEVDELAKVAANNTPFLEGTFYQILQTSATQTTVKAFKTIMITESKDWRHLIIDYLNNIHHSEDEASIARIAARAISYKLMDGILYKKGVVQPLLKCIT